MDNNYQNNSYNPNEGQPQGNPYEQQGNPYNQQGNPYNQQGNPYGQQGNPYGQQGGYSQDNQQYVYGPNGGNPNYNQQPPMYNPQPAEETLESYKMTLGDWVITLILMMIPCVDIIMLFVWAFGSNPTKKARVNWAKAQLIIMLASIVLSIIFLAVAGTALTAIFRDSYYY